MEVGYRSTREERFVNPGLLRGSYLGTAALMLMGCMARKRHHMGNFMDATAE